MPSSEPPWLVRYVPDLHLRATCTRWGLDSFFSGAQGGEYVTWLQGEAASLAALHTYRPTAEQLKRSVAAAIVDERRFVNYLVETGGVQTLEDAEQIAKLAKIAACIIVGLYGDAIANGGRGR